MKLRANHFWQSLSCMIVALIWFSEAVQANEPLHEVTKIYVSREVQMWNDSANDQPGMLEELFDALGEKLGREITTETVPWRRAQNEVANSMNLALAPITRNADREDQFSWLVPILPVQMSYFTLPGNREKAETLEQIRNLRVGLKGAGGAEFIAKLHELPESNISRVNKQDQLFRMLEADHIDAWLVIDLIANRTRKLANSDVTLERGYSVPLGVLYVAASPRLSKSEVENWRRAMDAVIADGTRDRIFQKYLGTEGY